MMIQGEPTSFRPIFSSLGSFLTIFYQLLDHFWINLQFWGGHFWTNFKTNFRPFGDCPELVGSPCSRGIEFVKKLVMSTMLKGEFLHVMNIAKHRIETRGAMGCLL